MGQLQLPLLQQLQQILVRFLVMPCAGIRIRVRSQVIHAVTALSVFHGLENLVLLEVPTVSSEIVYKQGPFAMKGRVYAALVSHVHLESVLNIRCMSDIFCQKNEIYLISS